MKLTICIILFISYVTMAQEKLLDVLPMKSSKVTYSEVIEVKNASKELLNQNLRHWIAFRDMETPMEKQIDAKHDFFTSRGTTKLLWGPNDYKELYKEILFNINIITKNERYQYTITNFIIKGSGKEIQLEIFKMDQSNYKSYNRDFYSRLDTVISEIISSLQKTMNKK